MDLPKDVLHNTHKHRAAGHQSWWLFSVHMSCAHLGRYGQTLCYLPGAVKEQPINIHAAKWHGWSMDSHMHSSFASASTGENTVRTAAQTSLGFLLSTIPESAAGQDSPRWNLPRFIFTDKRQTLASAGMELFSLEYLPWCCVSGSRGKPMLITHWCL